MVFATNSLQNYTFILTCANNAIKKLKKTSFFLQEMANLRKKIYFFKSICTLYSGCKCSLSGAPVLCR